MGNFFASHQVDEDAASGIGPCGKGDPRDFSLTQKELHVSIPKYQRTAAEMYKCIHLWDIYQNCADDTVLPWYICKNELEAYTDCIQHWSKDPKYREQIIAEYVLLREQYRRTGRRRLYRGLKGETYVTEDQLRGFQI